MKKLGTIITAVLLYCWGVSAQEIICTTFPILVFTRTITQDVPGLKVDLLMPANGGCPYEYVPTAGDIKKLSRHNIVLIANGLGLDDHMVKTARKVNPRIKIIAASPARNALTKPLNGHLFASPSGGMAILENLTSELIRIAPEHRQIFERNRQNAVAKLQQLLQTAPRRHSASAVFIQHSVFAYLGREIQTQTFTIAEDGEKLTALKLARLIKLAKAQKISAIWSDSRPPSEYVKILSKECKLPVIKLETFAGGPANASLDDYIQVMQKNYQLITSY